MAIDYTTAQLVKTIRRRTSAPNNQQSASDDASLIAFLNDEMHNMMVPDLMAVKEEYLVDFVDLITTQNADGSWQDHYEIPYQAIGMKLRDLTTLHTDAAGNNTLVRFVPRVTPEDVAGSKNMSTGNTVSFYLEGNYVVFYPRPTSAFNFRMSYFRRPNDLVAVSACGQVMSINTSTNSVVLTNVPATWSSANTVDCIQYYPGFEATAENVQIVSVSNPTVVLSSVANIQVGSWIALSGSSPVPQLPVECQSVLVQAAVVKVLEAMKDVAGLQIAQKKYEEGLAKMRFMITARVDGEKVKITSGGRGLSDYNNAWLGRSGYRR